MNVGTREDRAVVESIQRGMASGILSSFMQVGSAIGSVLTGVMLGLTSWQGMFAIYTVPGLLWAVWFLIWFRDEPGREFNKAAVQKYRAELEIKGLAPSSINVRLSAIRRLALEAADNGVNACTDSPSVTSTD